MLKTLKDIDLKGKKVFVRVDFNVPMKDGAVTDDTRIRAAVPTINYILEQGGYPTLATHLGRPKGEQNLKYSLKPVADYINTKGWLKVNFVEDCTGVKVKEAVESQPAGTVNLLENLRFHGEEEQNAPLFAEQLAAPFEVYINDAFGTSHRKHASVYGVPEIMPERAMGFLLEKEVKYFSQLVQHPERPFAALLGGAKVSDKIGVIESLLDQADKILIGGAMAYTFLSFKGIETGKSLLQPEQFDKVERILEKARTQKVEFLLPVDHIVSASFDGAPEICETQAIPKDKMGLDIGPETVKLYTDTLTNCQTVLWNGPMGVFENENYSRGTFAIAKFLANLNTTVVVGGGDSVAAINRAGVEDKISHISTGGGASLEYIEFGTLPGIEILRR